MGYGTLRAIVIILSPLIGAPSTVLCPKWGKMDTPCLLQAIQMLVGHEYSVWSLAITDAGALVSGSGDNSIMVW